jgi:hypothetical protein
LIYIEIITCLPFKKSQVTRLQQLEIKTLPSHQGKKIQTSTTAMHVPNTTFLMKNCGEVPQSPQHKLF